MSAVGGAPVRARAAHAGRHARRDHERPVRDRWRAGARHPGVPDARDVPQTARALYEHPLGTRGAAEHRARAGARGDAVGARRRRPAAVRRDPREARTGSGRGRGPHRRAVAAAQRARRRRAPADRPRDPRRADVAGARRARDDRELARVDVRAARAHAGRVRPAARVRPRRRSGRRRHRVHRGDDPRGHARPAGHPRDRADGEAAMAPRRVRGARRNSGRGQHRRAAPPPRRVSRATRVHARAVRGRQARDATPGSRSAVASGAASARRWRWPSSGSCSRRSPGARTWWRPGHDASTRGSGT